LGNSLRIDFIIFTPRNSDGSFDLKGRGHRERDSTIVQKKSERQRIDSGILKADRRPRKSRLLNYFQDPPVHSLKSFCFIVELAVTIEAVNKYINCALGNVNSDKKFFTHGC